MVGLGEGIAPSAATDMVARVIAKVCAVQEHTICCSLYMDLKGWTNGVRSQTRRKFKCVRHTTNHARMLDIFSGGHSALLLDRTSSGLLHIREFVRAESS